MYHTTSSNEKKQKAPSAPKGCPNLPRKLAVAAYGLLAFWKSPSWLVVLFCALGGSLIAILP